MAETKQTPIPRKAGKAQQETKGSTPPSRLYAARGKAQSYAKERGRATVRVATAGAARQGRRATGGMGAIFVAATAAGLLIMVIKRPALITTPLAFIASVFRAFTALAGKVTGK